MNVIGLTRIRNEEKILKDTLDHLTEFCDDVFLYDDCSTDSSPNIYENHDIVKDYIRSEEWSRQDRELEEFKNRQAILELAHTYYPPNTEDWIVYIDADERIEYDWDKLETHPDDVKGIKMKLFDFYITEEDKNLDYTERKYMGSEYREILMVFRNHHELKYHTPDQREITLPDEGRLIYEGYVKHYGKAISIEEWEKTCDYYAEYFPQYSEKWKKRKGKAIHTESDFGRPLITWDEKDEKGIKLH